MICPSCNDRLLESVKHCTHCGIAITRRSVQVAQIIHNCGWIARRALGGFFAGGMGWLISIAVSRTVELDHANAASFVEMLDLFPGKSILSCAIAGCFIGTVGGMIERSAYKSFLGGLLGVIGGLLGGLAHPAFDNLFKGQLYAYSFSMSGSWALTGAFVGLTSGMLEGTRNKILIGIAGGLIGGLLGGGISSQMYGALLMEVPSLEKLPWFAGRLIEFGVGGIVGVIIWSMIGLSEKLYIFKRRQLLEASKKVCDNCHTENILNAWYCSQCGSALQVAASREQIQVTPYRGLERIANALQFLSWLSATTGIVTVLVVFLSFLLQNFLFALFGSLLVALVVYIISVLLKSAAETVRIFMQLTEKLSAK